MLKAAAVACAITLLAVVYATLGAKCTRRKTSCSAAMMRSRRLAVPSRTASPTTQKCRFNFNEVREDRAMCAFGCCKCVQLSEVRLYASTHDGADERVLLNVSSIANPGGRSPPAQGPGSAADLSTATKWIDLGFPANFPPGCSGSSTLEIEVDAPDGLAVSAYEFVSGDDASWRDPTSWSVRCWASEDGRATPFELVDRRGARWGVEVNATTARRESYGIFRLSPPSPPSPPDAPEPPPAAPPPPAAEGELRLSGGLSPSEGRLEVFHSHEWGSVCDDRFGLAEAQVACL